MFGRHFTIALVAIGCSSKAIAAEYLTSLTSDVYQATGTPKSIATRASTCISQHLAAGTVNAPVIINSDLDSGTVVARSALTYSDGLLKWQARSVFTFEARENRFRIEQTNLERFNDMSGGWSPIGKWTGSGWKKAEAAFTASAEAVAQCITSGPKRDDW
jgi:hypothetical protein